MKRQPVKVTSSNMEVFFPEKVPVKKRPSYVFWKKDYAFWKYGEFYLNEERRVATVTDVKFLTKNKLIVAHRAAAKIYLIEVRGGDCNVLDSITLDTGEHLNSKRPKRRYFHPDLMTVNKDRIYLTEYSKRCGVVDVIEDRLLFKGVVEVDELRYHGCFHGGEAVLFGSVENGCVVKYVEETNENDRIKVLDGDKKRVKTVGMDGENYVLGLDQKSGYYKELGAGVDSWFDLCKMNNGVLHKLDSLGFPNAQLDGHVYHGGYHFITLHDGNEECGKIIVVKISNNKLKIVNKVKCNDFPHGIDVYENRLAYTSYSSESIVLCPLGDFLDIIGLAK